MNANLVNRHLMAMIAALELSLVHYCPAQNAPSTGPAKPADPQVAPKMLENGMKPTADSPKTLPADPEERFRVLFTKAFLSGRWAPLKDGVLGDEKSGDKYNIVSVTKGEGENWTVNAKLDYQGREFVMPIPVRMKFTGDTAILVVDNLMIPNGGTYSARLMIYERTYSGTWKSARGGGMLYGTISTAAE